MRLVTFNILHGRSLRDGLVDPDRLTAAVRALDPDILALQEVDRGQPRSGLADLTEIVAAAMGAVAHRFAPALSGTPGEEWTPAGPGAGPDGPAYGIALLSRYPAHSWRVHRLPRLPFRVEAHRHPPEVAVVAEEPREVLVAELDTPAGRLTVANTHLSFVPGWSQRQLRWVSRRLAATDGPVVVMGDLNMTTPWPAIVTGYQSLASRPTYPVGAPDRQLDHILIRPPLGRIVGSAAPDLAVSDHRALVVDLIISPASATREAA